MKTIEYTTVDKTDWGPGPWQDEPDKRQWQDEDTGLPCLIVRNGSGALCGYVGIAKGHPKFAKEYADEDVFPLEVHGGLTFSDFCADTEDVTRHVCHIPDKGEPDKVWWLGFDCSHHMDLSPKYAAIDNFPSFESETYKDINYVTQQCKQLAAQLNE